MMVAIFAAITLALAFGQWGPPRAAVVAAITALVLTVGLFLWEVYDPKTGFAMPWLQVERSSSELADA